MNDLDSLISEVSRNAAQQIREADPSTGQPRTWENIERILAETHLAFLWPLIPEPKAPFQKHDPVPVVSLPKTIPSIPGVSETTTRVTAVNWRGLFLENGRSTILEPSGTLYTRKGDLKPHTQLHKTYLDMAGKHVSINQIFLEWPIAPFEKERRHASALTVEFGSSGTSSLFETAGHVNAYLSLNVTRLLWPQAADRVAVKIVDHVLATGNGRDSPSRDLTEQLPPILQKAADDTLFAVLQSEFAFFEQFRSIFDPETSTGLDMFTKFFFWLRSLGWLQFYCREEVAGRFFYTARLPHLGERDDQYLFVPRSSISIVAATSLPDSIASTFRELRGVLSANQAYQSMQRLARERFETFLKKRRGAPSAEHPEYSLWCLLARKPAQRSSTEFDTFPMDFEKLAFLCRLTRYLAGQKHEGHALRFAFLLGFRHEQVLGQLEGWFEDFDMEPTWPFGPPAENATETVKTRLNEFSQKHQSVDRGNETIVAKWLEANALLLQRWDVVVLFESRKEHDKFPVASRIIRVRNIGPVIKGAYPSNEFELQDALQEMSRKHEMAGTAAVLISDRGAKLIVSGKVYLFRYEGPEGAKRLVPLVEGFSSVAESFETALKELLQQLGALVDDGRILTYVAREIRRLAEALVALGHGALIAVRATTKTSAPGLPPLAPVWKVKREETIRALSQDMLAFALAAALDGATEILVCRNAEGDKDEDIRTVVRFRCYVDDAFTPWERDDTGAWVMPLLKKGKWNSTDTNWGDLMTFGTRHRSAMALSLRDDVVVVTVSADGPVRLWKKGNPVVKIEFKP